MEQNYNLKILKQWYKKESDIDVKFSYSVKLETLGGYVFLTPNKHSYRALCILAEQHPELVFETNTKENPKVIQVK